MSINKYYILVTEGVTDCSLLEAIIEKYMGYKAYENVRELPQLFTAMIGKYPTVSGELKRQDSPTFYYKDNIGIAIKQANGYSQIPDKVSSLIENIDKMDLYEEFQGFLIFCDTDLKTKQELTDEFCERIQRNNIAYENDSLKVYGNDVRCKIYFFPNDGEGAVEKILLNCAQVSYSDLFNTAMQYRDSIMVEQYEEIRKDCWAKDDKIQSFYYDKVHFGAISTVLKPDRPVRFAIKDKIIRTSLYDEYMKLSEFRELHNFLVGNIV